MLLLVDTCGWIEWLTDGVLADIYQPCFAEPQMLIVPTALQFELYKWVKRERDEQSALEVVALTEQAQVLPLNTGLALTAADLALLHGMSFADAIIYGSARHTGATLVTSDSHFADLEAVEYHPKG